MKLKDDSFFEEQVFDELAVSGKEIRSNTFEFCKFLNCDFSESAFIQCKFVDCEFRDSNLNIVKIEGTRFLGTDFRNCKITGVNWTSASWTSVALSAPVSFHSCDVSFSVFHSLKLADLIIINSRAHDVDFSDCDLAHANFYGTDLKDARFSSTRLDHCNFSAATNYYIDPLENSVEGAVFSLPDVLSLLSTFNITIDEYE